MAQTATAPINPITNRPYSGSYNPGTDSGAITLEWRKHILRATVRSFTKPNGPRHTIEVNAKTGHVRCSCDAYRHAHKPGQYATLTDPTTRYCKHVATFWETLAQEVIEHNAEATPAPATKPQPEAEHLLLTQVRNARSRRELQELRSAVVVLGKANGLDLNWHDQTPGSKQYRALWTEIGHHVDFFRSSGREPLEPLAVAFLQAIGEAR